MYKNGKIIKWLGLEPLKISTIKVELVKDVFSFPKIDYSQINHMGVVKVGTHIKKSIND